MLSFITWNPDRNIFILPYLRHPVTWYGLLFALAFLLGYFIVRRLFRHILAKTGRKSVTVKSESTNLTDRLALFIGLGCIIGARLGHVFFYGWNYYKQHPWQILKIWEGGLASHGGALGILGGLLLFFLFTRKKPAALSWRAILDVLAIPTALGAVLIRIGNFINQEITGSPTNRRWGVVFRRPLDGVPGIPLHPVQIYEAIFYFLVFLFLIYLWKWKKALFGSGRFIGWLLTLVFGFRFFIEYLKMPQHHAAFARAGNALRMGQMLSVPFFLLGILFLVNSYFRKKR